MAILGHMADAERAHRPSGSRSAAGGARAVDEDFAARERANAGQRLEQFGLAVAGDARDAEDLARPQIERDVVEARDAAIVAHGEVARLQHDCAGMRGPFVDLQDDLAPDHRVGEFGRRGLRGLERRDDFAAPHHRDAVGQAHDLAQLVGDEDDRLVLRLQHPQHRRTAGRLRTGVSTAVGSSSTRISAPRTSAFRISTRCCRPTDNSPTIASGSTSSAYSLAKMREFRCGSPQRRWRAAGRPRRRA